MKDFFLGWRRGNNGTFVWNVFNQSGSVKAHEGFSDGAAANTKFRFKIRQDKAGPGKLKTAEYHIAYLFIGLQGFHGRLSVSQIKKLL